MSEQESKQQKWVAIIKTVDTPLGFFTLIILIVEFIFGILGTLVNQDVQNILIYAMIALIFCLVAIVSFMAYSRPQALRGLKREKESMESYSKDSALSCKENPLFWDRLSDEIVIVFGVEESKKDTGNTHPRISLRDLKAAQEILIYLAKCYPLKRIITTPASAIGWQQMLRNNTDLVIIGGFVSNIEFSRHQSYFKNTYSLRMGRICRTLNRQVYHVKFDNLPPGKQPPPRNDPIQIDSYPSEFVSKDYAVVISNRFSIYGHERNVISIAGIKGNGTLGGASYLTDSQKITFLDPLLKNNQRGGYLLELLIGVDIVSDIVNDAQLFEATIDGKSLFKFPENFEEQCEQKVSCSTCNFGSSGFKNEKISGEGNSYIRSSTRRRIKAIFFDLDDTIVDTFNILIRHLEIDVAKKVVENIGSSADVEEITTFLLRLRKKCPSEYAKMVKDKYPDFADYLLSLRNDLLRKLPINKLTIRPEVRSLLEEMGRLYDIYLISEGDKLFQSAKIAYLEIESLFKEVLIVSSSDETTKYGAIKKVLKIMHYAPDNCLIIGNRLDKDIGVGNKLGLTTVWLQHGEGAEMTPNDDEETPDYTVFDIREIYNLL